MTSHSLKHLPKNTVEITVTVPKEDIIAESAKAFEKLHGQLELKGFRKGKAPKDMAQKHLKSDAIYSEMLKTLLPRLYEEIVKKESLQPIISPKIELTQAKEGEDWEFKIHVALKPAVDVKNHKEIIAKVKADAKKTDIWIPGKDKEPSEEAKNEDKQKLLNQVLEALIKETGIEVSDLIIEEELNRRLSQLVDDVQKIGLTTESYLKSKNLTMDELKARFKREIEDTYKLEFILAEIADQAGIKVEQADIDKLFSTIQDEKERQAAQANAYLYASVLRKQKTLDYLIGL